MSDLASSFYNNDGGVKVHEFVDALGFEVAPFRSRWGFDFFHDDQDSRIHVESRVAALLLHQPSIRSQLRP